MYVCVSCSGMLITLRGFPASQLSCICSEGMTVRDLQSDLIQWTSVVPPGLEQLHVHVRMESNSERSRHLFIPQLHNSLA